MPGQVVPRASALRGGAGVAAPVLHRRGRGIDLRLRVGDRPALTDLLQALGEQLHAGDDRRGDRARCDRRQVRDRRAADSASACVGDGFERTAFAVELFATLQKSAVLICDPPKSEKTTTMNTSPTATAAATFRAVVLRKRA